MNEDLFVPTFTSPIATMLERFISDKRSRGYTYKREVYHLQQLDRFLLSAGLTTDDLPEELTQQWLEQTQTRKPSTHRKRIIVLRQLIKFMQLYGYSVKLPLLPWAGRKELRSAARIFSRDEMRAILEAADRLEYDPHTAVRHLVVPELFRTLYGCGLRVGEARRLTVADVDLTVGVFSIHQGKFHRDRLVPMAPELRERLKLYSKAIGPRSSDSIFFPAHNGRQYGGQGVYNIFRGLLDAAGIVHGGRGAGPRLHEVRHTFAVHRLEQWYRAGDDLNAKLPLLASYLGHRSMVGTQAYLQLTKTLFTDITVGLENAYGHVIPRGDC